jgi:hypothetical protein
MDPTQVASTIAALSRECNSNLDELAKKKEEAPGDDDLKNSVEDERGRFRVWAFNLGALQPETSPKSLDFRLKTASRMRDSVLSGLERLCRSGIKGW